MAFYIKLIEEVSSAFGNPTKSNWNGKSNAFKATSNSGVEVRWSVDPSRNITTFFPSTWSQDEILEQCASALVNPKKKLVTGKTRMFESESDSGIFMRWFEDANGNVTSIFPEF